MRKRDAITGPAMKNSLVPCLFLLFGICRISFTADILNETKNDDNQAGINVVRMIVRA
jgi:hypothetical protein